MKQLKYYICLFFIRTITFANENISMQDPFLWLESNDHPKTLEWLTEENSKSEAYFQNNEIMQLISKHLTEILDFDSIEIPKKIGENYIFTGRLNGRQQSTIYKMEEKGIITPIIETDEKDSSSIIGYVIQKQESLVAYGLSNSGSDWQNWRIRNLDNNEDLLDNLTGIKFTLPVWDEEGKGLFYFKFRENSLGENSINRQQLYYHRLGTASTNDERIFSTLDCSLLFSAPFLSEDGRYLLFSKQKGFGHSNGIVYSNLKENMFNFIELFPIENARYDYIGSIESQLFFITNENAPNGKIISIDPLIPESKRDHILENEGIIEQACFAGDKIVISYLNNACSQIKIFNSQGIFYKQINLPALCTTSLTWKNLNLSGSQNSNEFFFPFTDFTHPNTVYKADAETGAC